MRKLLEISVKTGLLSCLDVDTAACTGQADRCFIAHEGREVSGPEWALALREESQSDRPSKIVADGRMGSQTMKAITAFQRQQGFQVSGRIDNQTISALGLSNKIGAQGGATTTGQGGASAGQQAPAQQNQGANQPSTSGQGGANQQQAPAQQNRPAGQGRQDSGSK
jgi:peptidoglycan hydrolase-like protein with peptidoglycan-binding domain